MSSPSKTLASPKRRFSLSRSNFSSPGDLPSQDLTRSTPPRLLTSRFSDETLWSIKTPRLPSIKSSKWFSHSPPASPTRWSRYGHQASASESRLNIGSPTNVGRGSMDDMRVAEDDVLERGARVVSSVDDAFEVARGHGRNKSGESTMSGGSGGGGLRFRKDGSSTSSPPRDRISRSFSSPSPPPRPSRAIPPPPVPSVPLPRLPKSTLRPTFIPPVPMARTISPIPTLVDLPPRSDSRNDVFGGRSITPSRAQTPPTVAPLSIRRPSTPAPPPPPFRALLLRAPTPFAVRTKAPGSLLVELDVGGTKFVTSVETLVRGGRGGKLGEFVEAVVEEVREKGRREEMTRGGRQESGDSMYPPSEAETDDEDSLLDSSHFALSPFPSPFPFEHYDHPSDEDASVLSLSLSLDDSHLPNSPTSPIDPFAKRLFLPTPSPTAFITPASALSKPTLVASPLPHLRIHSVYPALSCKPSKDDDEEEDWTPGHHLSQVSPDEVNPFERALGPYFEVLAGQSHQSKEKVVERRKSLGMPVDIGIKTDEDKSRSTLLGIPRGSTRVRGPRSLKRDSAIPAVPEIDVGSEGAGSRPPSLCRSFSSDAEGGEKEVEGAAAMSIFLDRGSEAFADVLAFLRDGTFSSALSISRRGSAATTLDAELDVDETTLSLFSLHPSSALGILASLRTLEREASWLGMEELREACEVEKERVVGVVRWLELERKKEAEEEERRRVVKGREKAGWI